MLTDAHHQGDFGVDARMDKPIHGSKIIRNWRQDVFVKIKHERYPIEIADYPESIFAYGADPVQTRLLTKQQYRSRHADEFPALICVSAMQGRPIGRVAQQVASKHLAKNSKKLASFAAFPYNPQPCVFPQWRSYQDRLSLSWHGDTGLLE